MEPSYSQKMIFNMASVHHPEFGNFWIFCQVSVALLCVCVPDFVKFGRFAAEIWGITIFKMAAVSHVGFRNLTFSSSNLCTSAIKPPNSKFCRNRTIRSWVIAKKTDFQYGVAAPSWIWEILKYSNISVAWVKICVHIPNFVIFGRFATEIWRYNDFQNGCHPPCWIHCVVIILCRKTEFNALDIVLNFDVHRFHTFWYTSTIMFHHFSLKLPILPQFSCILKKYGKILNLNVVTAKRHIRAWDHVFWTPDA